MENFSLLSISGPRISSSAMNTFPDTTSSRATSLPDIQLTSSPGETQPPTLPISSFLPLIDYALGDTPSTEQLRRNCTIYRPWFSPYSYFVCTDKESQLETYSFPEAQRDEGREGRGDIGQPEDMAESICSSSSSLENACPWETTKKPRPGLDSKDYITSQDILTASKWHPTQQNGYKCVACCRMYPTLHSLKSHIKGGFREGFSCKVYYRKLKTLWGKEQKARPGDRVSTSSCQTFKGLKTMLCLKK
uniref:Spermatosis associated 46 n=1 Tax=Vombatus ursinus TaxID=29139 RepID=A0A4X2JT92_VOMUR